MTNKEYFIGLLEKRSPLKDRKFVEDFFNIVNKKDWAVFCSQMADDGDRPFERINAVKKMQEALAELVNGDMARQDAVTALGIVFQNDEAIEEFYRRYFHKMDEEFAGVAV